MLTREQIDFLAATEPPPAHWGATGALRLHPDPRDYDIRSLPGVADMLATGIPNSVDLTGFVRGAVLNQGAEGACVAFSTAHLGSIDDVIETGQWPSIDAETMYHRAGGSGQNGVDSRLVLQQAVDSGMPLQGGGAVRVVTAYAFVPQQVAVFTQTIKAALAAGYPVVLALLLPSDFGWQSGHGARTSGYHQICLIGYTADNYFIFLNSWGAGFGRNGIGSIYIPFIEADNLQSNYVFSYTVTPKAVPNPTPVPTPTPTPTPVPPVPVPPPARQATVGGRAIAGASNGTWPKVGSTIPFGVDVALTIESIVYDGDPTPNPQPNPNPQPQPDPAPDGGIQVFLTTKPSQFRNTVSIVVYTADKDGHSFPASVNGTVTGPNGVVPLQGMTTHGTQSPVIYTVDRPAPWGTPCTVEINAFNGSSTGTATKPG